MRISTGIVFLALALASCGKPDLSKPTAKSAATALGSILPHDIGGGMIATSAKSDGETLVLQLDNVLDLGSARTDETAKVIRAFACRNKTYRTLVTDGLKVRFNPTVRNGRHLPPVMLEACT